jgi:hypothetical protein
VTLRSSEGDIRVVPVGELGRELRQPAPFAFEADEEPTGATAVDVHDDEVPDETDVLTPVRAPIAEAAGTRETSTTDGTARPGGRRRGRRGGRRGRPGSDGPGSAPKE